MEKEAANFAVRQSELYIISETVEKDTALVAVRQCGRNRIFGRDNTEVGVSNFGSKTVKERQHVR